MNRVNAITEAIHQLSDDANELASFLQGQGAEKLTHGCKMAIRREMERLREVAMALQPHHHVKKEKK